MSLQDAIEEPRIYTNSLTSYRYESGMPEDVRQMEADVDFGHKFGSNPVDIGNVQSIFIDRENKTFMGVADSSRNGTAVGVNIQTSAK